MKAGNKVKVFYTPKQVLVHDNIVLSTSKSPLKPKLLMEYFQKLGLIKHMDVEDTFAPFDPSEFLIAHRKSWVTTFFEGRDGREANGIPWSKELTETVRYTNASLYNAIRHSIINPNVPCFSPTSGFHHARPASGSGFCTFAGQVIASVKIYREFGISGAYLDLDGHFGNSIEDCRKFQPEINRAVPKREDFNFNFNPVGSNEKYIQSLRGALVKIGNAVLLGEIGYVVWCHGADSHVLDDLGGQVDTDHWVEASKVFYNWVNEIDRELASMGKQSLPVSMSLFGGYREDSYESVISLHTRDMVECLNVLCGSSIHYEVYVKEKNDQSGSQVNEVSEKEENYSTRKLKVHPKHFQRANDKTVIYPEIRLSGKWLEELDFLCNEPVTVYCQKGELRIVKGITYASSHQAPPSSSTPRKSP